MVMRGGGGGVGGDAHARHSISQRLLACCVLCYDFSLALCTHDMTQYPTIHPSVSDVTFWTNPLSFYYYSSLPLPHITFITIIVLR